MPEQIELAASVSNQLAEVANVHPRAHHNNAVDAHCPHCGHSFEVEIPSKSKHLKLVAGKRS